MVKTSRFTNITFGKDVKVTLKDIERTPGPADYNTEDRRTTASEMRGTRHSQMQLRPASRECSFAVPLSGEPFSPFGALKSASRVMRKKRLKLQAKHFI